MFRKEETVQDIKYQVTRHSHQEDDREPREIWMGNGPLATVLLGDDSKVMSKIAHMVLAVDPKC